MSKKPQSWFFLWCLALILAATWSEAAPKLPTQTVKQLYKDGEFEELQGKLEKFLKSSGTNASLEDRIVAYKYLGVVYASLPGGGPQAEAYFFRLLDLSPNVQLTELYVSSSINSLFEKTQERFLKEKKSSGAVDELGFPIKDKGDNQAGEADAMARLTLQKPPRDSTVHSKAPIRNTPRQRIEAEKKGPLIWPWVVGAVVVGGGVGAYLLTSNQPDQKKDIIDVDAQ